MPPWGHELLARTRYGVHTQMTCPSFTIVGSAVDPDPDGDIELTCPSGTSAQPAADPQLGSVLRRLQSSQSSIRAG